jgi:hypothetical protein
MGVTDSAPSDGMDYDPRVYERVYLHLLSNRRTQVVPLNEILPTTAFSAYHFTAPYHDVVPSDDEVRRHIEAIDKAYPDPAVLYQEIDRWYVSP